MLTTFTIKLQTLNAVCKWGMFCGVPTDHKNFGRHYLWQGAVQLGGGGIRVQAN